jgi:hypothetical protein
MKKKKTQKGTLSRSAVLKELAAVDKLYKQLEKDKKLPTFTEFFVACVVSGQEECVNLRQMFPRLYKRLATWLANNSI